ncbi:fatty acid desaturase family protein [Nocardiaceae bacterium NPDC056970]
MAITNIDEYAHLSSGDIESLGAELTSIRRDVEDSRGWRDARYIRRAIAFQRALDASSRLLLALSRGRIGWLLGAAGLGVAKSIENMEIGHNVSHGQWDWMNDPEIHSATWEWDMAGTSAQWKYAHNFVHHRFTNVVGMDDDVGFGVMRVTRDQRWRARHLLQPIQNLVLAATFEWGVAAHDLDFGQRGAVRAVAVKIVRQSAKDYLLFPALSGRRWRRTLAADAAANLLRNLWAYLVIFCGHFPDGAEKFTLEELKRETSSEWYLRQILGTANFRAGPVLAFLSGNLCYQIEHHLFPDLPSNRYSEIAARVRPLCAKYDLPYTTGPLARQYWQTLRTILKLSLPDSLLVANSDDAPETASESRFRTQASTDAQSDSSGAGSRRSGLRTALRNRITSSR